LDLITPSLDGTILPGLTRASTLSLADAHTSGDITLPGVPSSLKIYPREEPITISQLLSWYSDGKVTEFFGSGTAAIIAPVNRIGWDGSDLLFPQVSEDGLGLVGRGMFEMITSIQAGKITFRDWSVLCA